MDSACRVIKRMFIPRFLRSMASYDVVSTIHQSNASTIHQSNANTIHQSHPVD